MKSRLLFGFYQNFLHQQIRAVNLNIQKRFKTEMSFKTKSVHCYKKLFPWKNSSELAEHLASTIVYYKDGLIALNKPFGIQIHHDETDTLRGKQRYVIPSLPNCDLTIEETLDDLKEHLNVPNLTILKSTERYSSGIVLLSTNENTTASVKKSFNRAKFHKIPYLIHWALTLGCPGANYKKEKVGLKFEEVEGKRQPIIVADPSLKASRLKKVHPVHVEYRVLSVNKKFPSSLVEISTSSTKFYFVRVYASSQISSILGDLLYSNRMNTLMGVPIKVHIQHAQAFDLPELPDNMAELLNLPKGSDISAMPTMLHLRSVFLPSFKGKDVIITADMPTHFKWTTEKLNLLPTSCSVKE